MAFRELTPGKAVGGGAGPRVTVALSKRAGAAQSTLIIGINADVLSLAGLKIGGKAKVLLGEGDAACRLRIESAKDGAFDLKGFGGPHKSKRPGCIFRISDLAFVPEVRDKRRAEWEAIAGSAGGLEITLPRSFFPQPVQPVMTAGPAIQGRTAPAAAGPRDATAAVLGDPPRGRSALGAR